MKKNYRGSPLFHMRLPEELYDWFRGYSRRTGKPMSVILKDHLQTLRAADQRTQPQMAKTI
jgi:predicted DNA-binding protein